MEVEDIKRLNIIGATSKLKELESKQQMLVRELQHLIQTRTIEPSDMNIKLLQAAINIWKNENNY